MISHFSQIPLRQSAYSSQPFAFLDQRSHDDLAAVMEIDLIENGDRVARENWQGRQLTNLLKHAHARSAFWRNRIKPHQVTREALAALPVLSRSNVMEQVRREGPLIKGENTTQTYATSGSTGIAVQISVTPQNARYNQMRSLAPYILEGRKLDEPRTWITPADAGLVLEPGHRLKVTRARSWIGSLDHVFASGPLKTIYSTNDDDALVEELLKDCVGHLTCMGIYMDVLLKKGGTKLLHDMGVVMWRQRSDNREEERTNQLLQAGIPCLQNYSCAEVGPVASECIAAPGYYHIAHSNVLVEIDFHDTVEVDGVPLGRVLLTHLHSYATPLIRYVVGDMAALHDACPCGHDGPTLSRIHGMRKQFIRMPDGKLKPFYLSSRTLFNLVSCKEQFTFQQDAHTIIIELGGATSLTPEEEANVVRYVRHSCGEHFSVVVKAVSAIDWSKNLKRLPFLSAVA